MPGMTQAKGMIVRTWSATATSAGAEDYSAYFGGTLLPELRKLPGFEGAYLLRRDLGEDGTAELTGSVSDQLQREEAVRLVQGVPGVERVRDRLTMKPALAIKQAQAAAPALLDA